MKGKWYLTHYAWDEMESMGNEDYTAKIPLDATNENDALVEAKAKWSKILADANEYWEKQKKTWVHPPSGPFHGLNPCPRVVYEILIEE